MLKTAVCVCFTVLCAAACGEKADPNTPGDNFIDAGDDAGAGGQSVVYSNNALEIKPILDKYCISCHSSTVSGAARNGAPVSINYDTYEAAVANAHKGNNEIQSGGMPPSGARPDAEEKQLFQRWVDTGLNK